MLGFVVGYVGGIAGIGGGPLLVAFLVLVCGMPQLVAQGNVLTIMLGPMSLLGILSLKELVIKHWKAIVLGVICYCICSYFGAIGAFAIGEFKIRILFASLLLLIALLQIIPLLKLVKSNATKTTEVSLVWIIIISSITGILGGLFGIGAGVLLVPILIGPLRLHKDHARAISLAILLPPVSLGAYLKYNVENSINWELVAVLFISYFIANYFGTRQGTLMSDKKFKIIYSVVLITISLLYFI